MPQTFQSSLDQATKRYVYTVLGSGIEVPATIDARHNSDLCLFIKSMTAIAGDGSALPMTLVVMDKTLKVDEMKVFKVNGLSHCLDPLATGYIVFSQKRSGSEVFFEWYLKNVIIEFVQSRRTLPEFANSLCLISSDGEPVQIKALLECSDLLDRERIIEAKHAASCSSTGNALDGGNYFKGAKAVNRSAFLDEIELWTFVLRKKLDDLLDENMNHMTKALREQISDGICRVVYSCQKVYTPAIVVDSFKKTGQLVNGEPNFDFKMSLCPSRIPKKDLDTMRAVLPSLLSIMRDQGYVTEDQYDAHSIVQTSDGRSIPKDERAFHQQRAMIINTELNLVRYRSMIEDKRQKALNRTSLKQVNRDLALEKKGCTG